MHQPFDTAAAIDIGARMWIGYRKTGASRRAALQCRACSERVHGDDLRSHETMQTHLREHHPAARQREGRPARQRIK